MASALQASGLSLRLWLLVGFICVLLPCPTLAQSATCSTLSPSNSVKPTVASGYKVALVATGLSSPRGIEFDTAGNLLVVEQGSGMIWLNFKDQGGECLSVGDKGNVIRDSDVRNPSPSFLTEYKKTPLTEHGICSSITASNSPQTGEPSTHLPLKLRGPGTITQTQRMLKTEKLSLQICEQTTTQLEHYCSLGRPMALSSSAGGAGRMSTSRLQLCHRATAKSEHSM
jgi:hypothetical protein